METATPTAPAPKPVSLAGIMTDRVIIESLGCKTCICGSRKNPRQTFCYSDYKKLPPEKQSALYDGFNDGYQQAVWDAILYLEIPIERVKEYAAGINAMASV